MPAIVRGATEAVRAPSLDFIEVNVMRQLGYLRNKKVLVGMAVLMALAATLWCQRKPLLCWYYLRGLASASETERDRWVKRVVSLDDSALPGLLGLLSRDDAHACANARAALFCLAQRSPDGGAALAERLATDFVDNSLVGRVQILELHTALLSPAPSAAQAPALLLASSHALRAAQQQADIRIQAAALSLAEAMADAQPTPEVMAAVHDQAKLGLASANARCRALALHLTRTPALTEETDLLELVVPLLRDQAPEVRREALQAVGLKDKVISAEDLLHLLHDSDREVQRWCEKALLARGLSAMDIELGRLITDAKAQERLRIFGYLQRGAVKDPSVWLQRLFDDPERAVRIAAARTAVELGVKSLTERLHDLVQNDRDQTVREVAQFWYGRRSSLR